MAALPLPARPRPRPARPGSFLRSLVTSSAAHGGLLGAGVLFGLVFAGGGRESAAREYVARFELGPAELPFEEREEVELTEVTEVLETPEPELLPTEVWGESAELPAEEPAEPTVLRSTDWLAEPPFLSGEIGGRTSSATSEPASAAVGVAEPTRTPEVAGPPVPVVLEPVARHRPAPSYPRLARRAGEEGSVLCRLHIAIDGTVERVEVVESSGSTRLDQAAREALVTWRFEPRREDGVAAPGTHLHRVTFRLDS